MPRAGETTTAMSPTGRDGVVLRRDPESGTNSVLVIGPAGVLVVDAGGDLPEARRILDDIDHELGLPVRALVLTHAHWDHSFGMAAFVERGATIIGHARIGAHLAGYESPRLDTWTRDASAESDRRWEGVRLTAPDLVIHERRVLDVIGRPVEAIPLPPGHTDGDLLVAVPDVDVIAAGDVVEESGPPMFGSGVHPLGWPTEVEELARAARPETLIIPGHGFPVDRAFVLQQAAALGDAVAIARGNRGEPGELGMLRARHPRASAWSDEQLDYARAAIGGSR